MQPPLQVSLPPIQPEIDPSALDILKIYAGMAWRRKWTILGALSAVMTAAIIYCVVAPKLYRSETLILVEDQKIAQGYVQSYAEGNLEQQIFLIQKQVKSRGLLADVVKEFDLYPEIVKEHGIDAAMAFLSDSITIEMVTGNVTRDNFTSRKGIDAFTISFLHEDPAVTMKVTGRIASKFIEQHLKSREQMAESNTEFLDSEVRAAKGELERREEEISRFKALYLGELPQQMEANMRALDRLQMEITAGNESIQRLSDRLALVDKAIQDYQRFGRTNMAFASGPIEPDPLFRRLKELREKLVKLQSEFWDTYPEVTLTKDELKHVEKQLIEMYGPQVLKPGEAPPDPYLQDLTRQRSEINSELALAKKRHQTLLVEQQDREKRVDRAPQIEQNLLVLERDYNNVKNSYSSLLEKRLNARVVENLEKRQQGGQFRIVDAANFPRAPSFPNQRRILLLAFLLGCGLGIGIVVVQEQLNPQFRHPEDIEQMRGPHLLAAIPDFSFEIGRMMRHGYLPALETAGSATTEANGHDSHRPGQLVYWKRFVKQGRDQKSEMSFVTKWWPASLISEQYRVAATRLDLLRDEKSSTVVAVTSAVKGEGKTTTTINLGYTLARDLGKRTLILDCDFGCPLPESYFKTSARRGLSDSLLDNVPLEQCLSGVGDVPCWIMPVGDSQFTASDLLLKAERFNEILAQCREQFEYVLLNTPPILPLATMNMLEQYVDLLVLVVRASSTTQDVVRRALTSLRTNRPVHVVLNAVESQSLPYYMYGSYSSSAAS
jgi:polysaccharide chain length determinant protein (PEP-CTERM system associated)